jgi:hypothetical protein
MTDFFTRKITMALLRDRISFEDAQRAFANPEKYKADEKIASLKRDREDGARWPGRYRWHGKVVTPRMTVAYCWAPKRNSAGYFLGWREVYNGSRLLDRDQFVSRKCKRRLKELQGRKTKALISKGAKAL